MTTKAELIAGLADDSGQTKLATTAVLEALENTVVGILAAGEQVTIPGVGKFSVKNVPARNARNPRTGETIRTEPKTKVLFKAAKSLKDAL
jgi:DNA-binding protein HU-beta